MPKKGRRAKGTGSIFFHGQRGVWVGRAIVGRKPNGKPLYVECSDKTQSGLVRKLAAAKAPGPNTTVGAWANRWLDGLRNRPGTIEARTNHVVNHITPTLGAVLVRDLTPYHVERAAAAWGEKRKPGSVRATLYVLATCLQAAVKAGIAQTNAARLAGKPKVESPKIDPFTVAELGRIIDAATAAPHLRIFALLAGTGMRVGEARALLVSDWDGSRVSVSKTVTGRRVGPPKTPNSVRTIRVPARAVPAVNAAAAGRKPGEALFGGGKGGNRARSYNATLKAWDRLLRRLNLRPRNPHQLRHTAASHLVAAGYSPADVASYLGDTVQTIVATYLHPTGKDPCEGMEKLLS